jgi:hypothetical protein
MLDGKVAEGDNDMQCVKPAYSTKQVACSGSVGKSLWDLLTKCQPVNSVTVSPTQRKLLWYNTSRVT